LKDQYPQKKIAVYSSWQDNRTKLVGEGLAETGNIRLDQFADGFELDTVNFPHDKKSDYMHRIDEHVIDEAVKGITETAPDLSWIYLEYTDDMGHRYGDSPELDTAVEMTDKQIGRVWDAIQYREQHFKEQWLIIITTDHGRSEANGRNHGGQSPRQRGTWMITNEHHINSYPDYYQPGIVDIFPTIARYMNIRIPLAINRELDGVPLIGAVSLADMSVNYIQGKLDISWTALDPKENSNVKVWVSATNNAKTGGTDNYQLMGEVPLNRKHIDVSVKDKPSSFYKIVVEGRDNSLNKWIILPAQGQ
jgi:Type I phosphodiesterase / nucleotide pyrophosphatase